MRTLLYTTTQRLASRLRGQLPMLAAALLLAPAAWAQVVIPAGNPTGTTSRKPYGNYFGYERSAAIYTAADVSGSGSITSVGFYLESVSTPAATPAKVYLKTTTSTSFAAAGTTVAAEETGATLVYDATIPATAFTASTWVTVALTAPFAYNGTDNLEIIVEANGGGTGTEGSAAKTFRFHSTAVNRFQSWQADNAAPTTAGTVALTRPNIQLIGLTPAACAAPSGLAVATPTATTATVTFTAGTGNTGYTLTYTPQGGTAVTQTVTASPVSLTGLAAGTAYTLSVVGNCAGSTTSAANTTSFTTPILNDDPVGAITLPIATTCTPVNGTNAGATTTTATGYTNPGCGAATSPKDVWFKFTTDATGASSTGITVTVTGAPAGQVRLFSTTTAGGAAGPFTQVGCAAGTTNNTAAPALVSGGLTPSTTYYIFVSGYGSADTQGAFTICLTPPPACGVPTNFALSGITGTTAAITFTPGPGNTSYTVTYTPAGGTATTVTPAPTGSPINLTGLTPSTVYTLSVTGNCSGGATTAPFTATFTTPALAPANDDPAGAVTLAIGTTCTPVSGTNAGATTTTPAGYVNPTSSASCGIAVSPKDVWYKFTTAATGAGSTSVSIQVTGSAAGYLRGFSTTGGAAGPFTEIGCASSGANNVVSAPLNLTGLAPSTTYYVFVSGYGSADTQGAFTICASSTIPVTCGDPTAATIGGATNTSLQVAFTPGLNNLSYIVTYSSGGAATTVTPAPTASPITITGLAPGTTYTLTLQSVCAGGSLGGVLTGTASTTGTPPAATYATVPYSESFEGPWVNGLSTRDLPTVNWRNSPATGNNSWRRDDDGTVANWASNLGAFTPASSQGTHAARFHSYDATSAATGTLDLYVNMSSAGSKTLSFDYVNVSGTDKLDVLVSTDGGATFGTTPVLTATTNATFTAKTVAIASTSATTVIRFRATSDFGFTDIGLDNVQLRVLSANRNEALAATVGLYPNPAHRSFTLSVPAGSLHAASASLINALGQVVQTRQLNLPAAGGTADFDVTNLATGVYSLQLKTGETLVVKRVVVE
ncbi:fibronectin type III domain-containing protein [Hymenobacter terricola]|uniref:fibronectin type III domain-containing protein n=1 Tax=Hymenobacter terricola TaxID=2819236 RepID=UPI001B302CD9|nr:fibronectin type III domain-containing protein [Hymenobacter terricola]